MFSIALNLIEFENIEVYYPTSQKDLKEYITKIEMRS